MLIPRKVKFRKHHRGKRRGISLRGYNLDFGKYGLKARQSGWLTSRQIEAARRAITRYLKRGGKVWIRVFPDKAVTVTAAETGMGGGKGTLSHFVAKVLPGKILFELDGVSEGVARQALKLAADKMPITCHFIQKES